jgi:hypothetical protein
LEQVDYLFIKGELGFKGDVEADEIENSHLDKE